MTSYSSQGIPFQLQLSNYPNSNFDLLNKWIDHANSSFKLNTHPNIQAIHGLKSTINHYIKYLFSLFVFNFSAFCPTLTQKSKLSKKLVNQI